MGAVVIKRITRLAHRYGGHVPLSRLNTVERHIDRQVRTIMDIGCNDGSTMLFINRRKYFHSTGLDVSQKAIEAASAAGSHEQYVCSDVAAVPGLETSYDLVLCLETIEHLEKQDGLKLLAEIERLAAGQIIISTPVGFHELIDHPAEKGADHKSGWSVAEFKNRGYEVKGNKLRIERRFGNIVYKYFRWLIPAHTMLWFALDTLLAPLPYYFPARLRLDMVCVKNLVRDAAEG